MKKSITIFVSFCLMASVLATVSPILAGSPGGDEILVAPIVISYIPDAGATGVALDADIVVVYDQAMDTGAGVQPDLDQIGGTPFATFSFGGWSLTNVADDTATFTHDATNWAEKQGVTVGVSGGQNAIAEPFVGTHSWSFTTVDLTNPTVVPTPADPTADVPTALGTYTLTFNEPMQDTGTEAQDTGTEAFTTDDLPAGAGWGWTDTTHYEKITLPALAEQTTYNVVLDGSTFLDLAGLPVTQADVTFEFTTADETNPTVVPTPADPTADVPTALGTYTLTFNEPMQDTGTEAPPITRRQRCQLLQNRQHTMLF